MAFLRRLMHSVGGFVLFFTLIHNAMRLYQHWQVYATTVLPWR